VKYNELAPFKFRLVSEKPVNTRHEGIHICKSSERK
jgi:hypothetical protein